MVVRGGAVRSACPRTACAASFRRAPEQWRPAFVAAYSNTLVPGWLSAPLGAYSQRLSGIRARHILPPCPPLHSSPPTPPCHGCALPAVLPEAPPTHPCAAPALPCSAGGTRRAGGAVRRPAGAPAARDPGRAVLPGPAPQLPAGEDPGPAGGPCRRSPSAAALCGAGVCLPSPHRAHPHLHCDRVPPCGAAPRRPALGGGAGPSGARGAGGGGLPAQGRGSRQAPRPVRCLGGLGSCCCPLVCLPGRACLAYQDATTLGMDGGILGRSPPSLMHSPGHGCCAPSCQRGW